MAIAAKNSAADPAKRFTRAAIIANPLSGRGKARRAVPEVIRILESYSIPSHILEEANASHLENQVREECGSGTDLVVSVGGDGTLQTVVNGVYGANMTVAAVPAGGGNDFVRALGLPLEPGAALGEALRGTAIWVDLIKVRMANGSERFYLGGGGVGLDRAAAKHGNTTFRNWPGGLRYVAAALLGYMSREPQKIKLVIDDESKAIVLEDAVLASVLNTPTFGAGIRLAPEAKIDDGLIDVALLEKLSFRSLVSCLPRLMLTGEVRLPKLLRAQAKKVRIECAPAVGFQGDGELLGTTPVEIEVVQQGAKFLVPKNSYKD